MLSLDDAWEHVRSRLPLLGPVPLPLPEAVGLVRSLMFLDRFAADVDRRLDALGQ